MLSSPMSPKIGFVRCQAIIMATQNPAGEPMMTQGKGHRGLPIGRGVDSGDERYPPIVIGGPKYRDKLRPHIQSHPAEQRGRDMLIG